MSDLTEIDLPVINTVEDFKIHLIIRQVKFNNV